MKKIILSAGFVLLSFGVRAQVPYMEEVKALGLVSGQGMACGASKYDTFEMLARAILVTKAGSDKIQSDGVYEYSKAKADSYVSKQMDGFYDCANINRRFDAQAIFDMKLYEDGTIQMPDGKIFTPRTPYDVTLVYNKNNKVKEGAKAIYDGGGKQKADVQITTRGIDGVQTKGNVGSVPNVPEYQARAVGRVITKESAQPQAVVPASAPAPVQQNNGPTVKRVTSKYK